MTTKQMIRVPVAGGDLAVAVWGDGPTPVVALHGITANHVSWTLVAERLAGCTLYAPDLRGRGDSAGLPAPYGYQQHIDDVLAMLDHLGLDRVVLVGHSMGGLISAKLAVQHPDRLAQVVFIDGGPTLPLPADLDTEVVLDMVLGPSMQRLAMTFPTFEDYLAYWRPHPALVDDWSDDLEAYLRHDVHEVEGGIASRVVRDAVLTDGRDPLVDAELHGAIPAITVPMHMLWAHRGLLGADPLYPRAFVESLEAAVDGLDVTYLTDVNHYTVTMSPRGADHVAAAVHAAMAAG